MSDGYNEFWLAQAELLDQTPPSIAADLAAVQARIDAGEPLPNAVTDWHARHSKKQHFVVAIELGEMDHFDVARELQKVMAQLTRVIPEDAYKDAFPIAGGRLYATEENGGMPYGSWCIASMSEEERRRRFL